MREEKQLLLDDIKDKINSSSAFVVANYQGLGSALCHNLRTSIAKCGGDFEIVKKRIFLKAAEQIGIKVNFHDLPGHIGIVFAIDDPVTVVKAAFDFAKENKKTLTFIQGRFEGQDCSADDVKEISKLPSKDQMRSELLGLFEAPMSQMLSVMEALLLSPIYCLENKVEQNEGSSN